jgi:hypothetical protein
MAALTKPRATGRAITEALCVASLTSWSAVGGCGDGLTVLDGDDDGPSLSVDASAVTTAGGIVPFVAVARLSCFAKPPVAVRERAGVDSCAVASFAALVMSTRFTSASQS